MDLLTKLADNFILWSSLKPSEKLKVIELEKKKLVQLSAHYSEVVVEVTRKGLGVINRV